jgi:hypothetical protein
MNINTYPRVNTTRKIKTFRNVTISKTTNITTMNKKLKRVINILREYLYLYDETDPSSPFQDTYLILFNIFGENMSAHFRHIIDTPRREGDKFKYKLDSYILKKHLHIFSEEESENPEEYVKKIISFMKLLISLSADRQYMRDEIKVYMKEFIGVCNTIFRLWNENLDFIPENVKEDPEVDELTALLSRL